MNRILFAHSRMRRTVVAFTLLLTLVSSCRPEDARFAEWDLPADMPDHLKQLEMLQLSGPVDDLSWLAGSRNLKHLELVAVDDPLPMTLREGLEHLAIRGTTMQSFPRLPRSLRSLELTATGIGTLHDLPELEHLSIEGESFDSGPELPTWLTSLSSLRTLMLVDLEVPVTSSALPVGLQRLELTEVEVSTLNPLHGLLSLTLRDTGIHSLGRPAPDLQEIHLLRNKDLDIDLAALPRLLSTLTLDANRPQSLSAAELPRELDRLNLVNTWLDEPAQLPSGLSHLVLRTALPIETVLTACPELESLTLEGRYLNGEPLDVLATARLTHLTVIEPPAGLIFPGTLEELTLVAAPDLSLPGVGEKLTSLTIQTSPNPLTGAQVTNLTARFPNLEHLAVTDSRIDSVPSLAGAQKLVRLDLSLSTLGSLAAPLPPKLTTLTLTDARISALPNKLPHITHLDISNSAIESWPPEQTAGAVKGDEEANRGYERIQNLTVHVGQLPRLGESFPNLTTLIIVPRRDG